MNHARVIAAARGLRSMDGENPEYDRALVELSADLLGYGDDGFREALRVAILDGQGITTETKRKESA